jgi:hypothetical protein
VPQVHRTMWAVLGLAGRWRIVMHQSGLHQRVSNMVRHYREQSDGLEVAPAILLGLYCAVAGCFGVWSVRPSSAYAPFKSQPVRVPISTRNDCDLCAIAPIERCTAADPLVEAAAPQPETTGTTAQWRNDVQKPHRQVKSERPRRQRETSQRKKQRSPTMDYAAQPFLGGSRLGF